MYKLNKYLSIIQLGDNYYLFYNALNDTYIGVSSMVDPEILKIPIKSMNPIYDQLIEIGGIVDEDFDETREVFDRIKKIDNDVKSFNLIINPTLACNFRCWYCYEAHEDKSLMTSDILDRIRMFIHRILDNNKTIRFFNLSFFGGEPLLGFDRIVKPIINETMNICSENNVQSQVSFTTNGYLLNDQRIKFFENTPCSFQITLDGGRIHHNATRFTNTKEGSFDTIIKHIVSLVSVRNFINLRINYTLENILSIEEILDELKIIPKEKRCYIAVDFQRVWQDRNKEDEEVVSRIIDEVKTKFEEEKFGCHNHSLDDRIINSCYADKYNQLLINYNGDVFKCTARDFTSDRRLGFIDCEGKIKWDSDRITQWNTVRFSDKYCHDCKIAPICGGGCSQAHIESRPYHGCHLGYSDVDIENIILRRFQAKNLSDFSRN